MCDVGSLVELLDLHPDARNRRRARAQARRDGRGVRRGGEVDEHVGELAPLAAGEAADEDDRIARADDRRRPPHVGVCPQRREQLGHLLPGERAVGSAWKLHAREEQRLVRLAEELHSDLRQQRERADERHRRQDDDRDRVPNDRRGAPGVPALQPRGAADCAPRVRSRRSRPPRRTVRRRERGGLPVGSGGSNVVSHDASPAARRRARSPEGKDDRSGEPDDEAPGGAPEEEERQEGGAGHCRGAVVRPEHARRTEDRRARRGRGRDRA